MQNALCIQNSFINTYQLDLIMKKKKTCYFIRNKRFKDILISSMEIKDIREIYQIPAICVVKMRFPYLIRNDTFIRSKERKEVSEQICCIFIILWRIKDERTLWFWLNTLYLGSILSAGGLKTPNVNIINSKKLISQKEGRVRQSR